MIVVDGSRGEGGGQVLRTALALALVTGEAARVEHIRARRKNPGLMRQHLTAVRAAATISQAEVEGDEPGSRTLWIRPGRVQPGDHLFSIGTAGSATLVLQTVLPPLLLAGGPSRLVLEGGTYNPMAPPYDFLARAFLPLVERTGHQVKVTLEKPGFYPAGGGRIIVEIVPAAQPVALELVERGEIRGRRVRSLLADLPRHIGERELKIATERLGWPRNAGTIEQLEGAASPGNVLVIEVECDHVTEVFTGFGERGVPAEKVANRAADAAIAYLESGAAVGPHLADQLMLPLAIGAGGRYSTGPLTPHTTTNREVIELFLPGCVQFASRGESTTIVECRGR